jgi:hypothetical protein
MKSYVIGLLLTCLITSAARAIEPVSVAQIGGPTVAALVSNIVDENSPLRIVGPITAANNTKIAGSTGACPVDS